MTKWSRKLLIEGAARRVLGHVLLPGMQVVIDWPRLRATATHAETLAAAAVSVDVMEDEVCDAVFGAWRCATVTRSRP